MVKSWAPEPPEDRDDHLPVLSSEHLIFPQSEDSDDHSDPPAGYTLFANVNAEYHSNDETDDEDIASIGHLPVSSENNQEMANSGTEVATHSQTLPIRSSSSSSSDTLEVSRLYSAPRPSSDIVIDCEEVRAAMTAVTLPSSSFPAWAVGVSDIELTNHIQRLLNKTTPTNSGASSSTAVNDG